MKLEHMKIHFDATFRGHVTFLRSGGLCTSEGVRNPFTLLPLETRYGRGLQGFLCRTQLLCAGAVPQGRASAIARPGGGAHLEPI